MSWPGDLRAHVGEHLTLSGIARNGAAGALLSHDGYPVYVVGLEEWPDELFGREVEASGTLVFRPRQPDGGVIAHQLDDSYALDDASWSETT